MNSITTPPTGITFLSSVMIRDDEEDDAVNSVDAALSER
jgi:hypothetical protein